MSFKWQGETATSRIYDILWSTSRLGVVTPVAVIDTVNLSGANISNVTLHNAANVKNFNLKYGDTIELVRSGEVIPKFLHVVKEGSGVCELPTKCQSCENLLEFDGVRLLCKNFSCPAQRLGGILNWIKCVGIDDLSERRLSALIKVGLVNEAADLYQLSIEDFLSLPLVKEKMAQKLHDNIQKSKHISLNQFLSGLGIKGVGSTSWEVLLLQYSSLDEIKRLSVEQICEIKGFALKTAEVIVSGLKLKENEINNLLNVGVKPSLRNKKESQEFVNKNFVITGTFSLPRKKLVELIERSGGKVQNSVTSQTNILLIADTNSTSSKAKKAKELGVIMWDEYKLLESIKA